MSTNKIEYSLGHIWTMTKYRGRGFTVRYIIDSDLKYVTWLIENDFLTLDNEAYLYYEARINENNQPPESLFK